MNVDPDTLAGWEVGKSWEFIVKGSKKQGHFPKNIQQLRGDVEVSAKL